MVHLESIFSQHSRLELTEFLSERQLDQFVTVVPLAQQLLDDSDEGDEQALAEYNKSMNKLLTMNAVFKKRRNIFKDNSKAQFEDASQNILNSMTSNMGSLYAYLKLRMF